MRKVVVDIINKLNIDSEEDKKYLIYLVDCVFLGKNGIDIMVSKYDEEYFIYTFVNSDSSIKERFIYGKYKTADENEAINIIVSHLLHYYVRMESHKIFGWDEFFEVNDEVLRFETSLLEEITTELSEDTKEYCNNGEDIYSITEDVIDTDFYRNWIYT